MSSLLLCIWMSHVTNTLCAIMRVGKSFERKVGSWPNWTVASFLWERVCVVVIFPSCQHPIHLPPQNSLRCCSQTFPVIFLLYLDVVCSRASWAGIGNARPGDDSQTFSCLPQCCISDCRRWVEQVIYLLLRRAVSCVFPRNSTRLAGGRTHFSTATIGFPAPH